MKNNTAWSIIFCSLCYEPTPPKQIVTISGHQVCESCALDRFPQPETPDYHAN